MNRSVVQWLQELEKRMVALEKKTSAPQEAASASPQREGPYAPPAVAAVPRSMCPKCGEQPNYYFHVKWCKGKKEEQKDAEADRRRDQGPT